MSSITSPAAISAVADIDSLMFLMLSVWTKTFPDALIQKKITSPTATTKMLASRRRMNAPATRQPRPARRSGVVASATAISRYEATAISRYETGYFCLLDEPSERVFVVRYGLT